MYDRTECLNNDIPDSVLLKYAVLDLKKARVEIGKLEAYVEELEHEIKILKKRCKNYIPQEKFDSTNAEKNKHIRGLEAKNEKLVQQIYQLNYELSQYKNKGGFQNPEKGF